MTKLDTSTPAKLSSHSSSAWSRAIVRGVRANDLSGKAGEIASELEDRLVRGAYKFGENLSIYNLAKEFGASRQPVSAAVLYLGTVGYLEIIPQVGCRVVSPSPQDVEDFYMLFARTEALIARFASERYQEDEAIQLKEIANALLLNSFQNVNDRRNMADDISIFHDHMSAMARSKILVDRISNLRRIFRFYLSQNHEEAKAQSPSLSSLNQGRVNLAEKIIARDALGAERHMESYILDYLQEWARVV
ncbi:GntR family transcriptional regulator [Spongiibacter sp. UBA1325]|uniref:GntR family transcriptional regulator n=1 Tax=Spongiibacter sp. UBA1325 TaxID=1947543 RepID=UPI00257D9DE8|nr:GntR family transcriptional regulator [Spongiibacter sp. UBA1325]|tara:strand:- start:9057 stop:9800 length:744 start_codon:yes stop_codon:yes gene_type:complete